MDVYKMEALKVLGSKKKQVDLGGKSMYGERSDRKWAPYFCCFVSEGPSTGSVVQASGGAGGKAAIFLAHEKRRSSTGQLQLPKGGDGFLEGKGQRGGPQILSVHISGWLLDHTNTKQTQSISARGKSLKES